ncbi:glutathione S-transferase [Ponticaulis sp.]|uniref:glutathione S-transferase n=1 Tax=Ponticaulis sp. TaxID=2020902 RepID=UPI000B69DAC2|nr:glutathione S-transferase [Ponticaulis sp.]MAI90529.1 glutathione S-transferase [Ponticaulis sp.]OUY00223.1 MAG: hypothetical protein CBB65_08830 [Hyphomonadaceae bacterium TMED5]|tara:strand:- start:155723 stop:156859 length:1137 start_codon:yes stop_codon:yes gene_type:complete
MTAHGIQHAELFGLPHSYYTVIARSYLRKQQAGVKEVSSRDPRFISEILPQIGRGIIPVLRLADGTVIQDSLDIIEYGEANAPRLPATPDSPKQKLISAVFFLYGSQSLLKAAMHYRWSFYDQQKTFLDHAFGFGDDGAAGKIMDRMRSYLPILGVSEATIPAIERNFENVLRILDRHFSQYPYLFGGCPSLGDYGLFGPLFAHLGRDPVPCAVMKSIAPHVFRWTERMNASVTDQPEFNMDEAFLPGDQIPETLYELIDFIGSEVGDELTDRIDFIRQFQASQDIQNGAPVTDTPKQRAIGTVDARYGGQTITVAVQPYLLYCQKRVETAFAEMNSANKDWASSEFEKAGLSVLLNCELPFTVGRSANIEVWERRAG